MTIGILYESKEWSTYALRDHIAKGVSVKLFDLQEEVDEAGLLSCKLILNRVFASAVFRGHQKALEQMPGVIALLEKHAIPMINPAEAHFYETSKSRSKEALVAHGFPVPALYCKFDPAPDPDGLCIFTEAAKKPKAAEKPGTAETTGKPALSDKQEPEYHCVVNPDCGDAGDAAECLTGEPEYPCIVKPDCGGRTNCTFIVNNGKELRESLAGAPDAVFLAEEYIRPVKGFVTRLEIIGGVIKLALKRGVTENGLSAYRLGSKYEFYNDLPSRIGDTAIRAMECLRVEAGSMDIIENAEGFYIIDVNSVSNASEDNTRMFNFDLMAETAAYALKRYSLL